MPWAICFVESTFRCPILAGAELLSPFIDEDTRAHWHPAFIYTVTTGDGWGEQDAVITHKDMEFQWEAQEQLPERTN